MDTKDTKETREKAWFILPKFFLCVLGVLSVGPAQLAAQQGGFAMPDAKEMSGIPRPVDDLPNGAVSIRLIRGALSNNITNHPVDLKVGSKVVTVKTDENGRAEFKDLTPGTPLTASADVDGEHLESPEFAAPARGGIRMLLVATDPAKKAAAQGPAQTGTVTIGDQSRLVVQPREEAVDIFYLLDISNTQSAPVNPPAPFVFDMPAGASGTTIMDGSSPQASVKGLQVTVKGPFAPGHTFVQVATQLPAESGEIDLRQTLPANLAQLAVIVKKVGDTAVTSPQLKEQREMAAEGEVYIAATGGAVAAGQPIVLTVTGIPHHSQAPRRIALAMALAIVLAGAWFATRPTGDAAAQVAERKRLIARREKLLGELARLEQDRRGARGDQRRHAARHEELIASLEVVYGALDSHDIEPDPAGGAGQAAAAGMLGAS